MGSSFLCGRVLLAEGQLAYIPLYTLSAAAEDLF